MYDPNSEATNAEQVVGGHWELLRRNIDFRALAKRWLASEEFRRKHVLTSEYHDTQNHTPRCALDWMLTAEQRAELAAYQIQERLWFYDSKFNFGPIVTFENFSAASLTPDNWQNFLSVKPKFNPPPPISIDLSWDRTPALFKQQFRCAHGTGQDFGEINLLLTKLGNELRRTAKKIADGNLSVQTPIAADRLFKVGSDLSEMAEFCKVFKIPRERLPATRLKLYMEQIRTAFKSANLVIPTKKYNLHNSYQGTGEDWRWFLQAESLDLDIRKSADVTKLAELYSADLRQRTIRGQAPRRAKALGHTGSKFPSCDIKNRRSTVKRHVLSIQKWIHSAYPRRASGFDSPSS